MSASEEQRTRWRCVTCGSPLELADAQEHFEQCKARDDEEEGDTE